MNVRDVECHQLSFAALFFGELRVVSGVYVEIMVYRTLPDI